MSEHLHGAMHAASQCAPSSPASNEFERLIAYAEEFARILELYDSAPAKWQYFLAHVLCLYARGMVTGQPVAAVRNFAAEADQECVQNAITAKEQAASHAH